MAVNVGQGTIIQATISASMTSIFQVTEITGPELTVGKKDKTNLADVFMRYRPQLPDVGPLSFTVQYDPPDATHAFMYAQMVLWPQPIIAMKMICNTASGTAGFTFNGFFTKFSVKGMNQEDNLEADIEIQIDGQPVRLT